MSATNGTATFVRKIDGWRGDARLYKLSKPTDDGAEFVIASAVDLNFGGYVVPDYRTSETMVFPATSDGVAVDMGEIGFVPYKSIDDALVDAGFEVAS